MENKTCIKCQDNYADDGRKREFCDKCNADYTPTDCELRIGCEYEISCQLKSPNLHECPDYMAPPNTFIMLNYEDVMYCTIMDEAPARRFIDEHVNALRDACHEAILNYYESQK